MTDTVTIKNRVRIVIENHVADVRLIRSDKMNALDPDMFAAIIEAGQILMDQTGVRAVVLSGEGRSFCAGLDLASLTQAETGAPSDLIERTYGDSNMYQQLCMLWRKLPMPVIAAVHGVCFGGGLQIMSGADIRIVAPNARLSVMEMKWGIIPDMGGFAVWRGYVRDDVMRELTYTNREFSGEEAVALGFATYNDADPQARAIRIAQDIAGKNPDAIRTAKSLFNRAPDMDSATILLAESEEQSKLLRTPNQLEAVMASTQKRDAKFED